MRNAAQTAKTPPSALRPLRAAEHDLLLDLGLNEDDLLYMGDVQRRMVYGVLAAARAERTAA